MPGTRTVPITYSAETRRFGESERALVRSAELGELNRVRRGSYVDSALWKALSPEDQHFALVLATHTAARRAPVFSHESAAVLWGFPIVEGLPRRAQVTVAPGSGLRSNKVVARHEGTLEVPDVVELAGLRVTSIVRTLLDYAAGRSFLSGACAADFVLQHGGISRRQITTALEHRRPFRGSRKVASVVDFASALSESANETLCRVRFEQLGFPRPQQQKEYRGSAGQNYSVDFYWPEFDVICETDGRVKYEDPEFLAGRTPGQALWDEKVREDELRAQCRGFVRLTWDDAWNRAGLVAKLTRVGIPRRG